MKEYKYSRGTKYSLHCVFGFLFLLLLFSFYQEELLVKSTSNEELFEVILWCCIFLVKYLGMVLYLYNFKIIITETYIFQRNYLITKKIFFKDITENISYIRSGDKGARIIIKDKNKTLKIVLNTISKWDQLNLYMNINLIKDKIEEDYYKKIELFDANKEQDTVLVDIKDLTFICTEKDGVKTLCVTGFNRKLYEGKKVHIDIPEKASGSFEKMIWSKDTLSWETDSLNKYVVVTDVLVCSIAETAFTSCVEIQSITFSKKIINIAIFTFTDCIHLESVYLSDIFKSISKRLILGCHNLNGLMLPRSIEKYQRKSVWGVFRLYWVRPRF